MTRELVYPRELGDTGWFGWLFGFGLFGWMDGWMDGWADGWMVA